MSAVALAEHVGALGSARVGRGCSASIGHTAPERVGAERRDLAAALHVAAQAPVQPRSAASARCPRTATPLWPRSRGPHAARQREVGGQLVGGALGRGSGGAAQPASRTRPAGGLASTKRPADADRRAKGRACRRSRRGRRRPRSAPARRSRAARPAPARPAAHRARAAALRRGAPRPEPQDVHARSRAGRDAHAEAAAVADAAADAAATAPARASFQRKRLAFGPTRTRATVPERTGQAGREREQARGERRSAATALSRVGGSSGGDAAPLPAWFCARHR